MLTVVALVVVQVSLEEPPALIVVGFESSVQVGDGSGVIVTVTAQRTLPPAPVAVRLYVCVPTPRAGLKLYEPDTACGLEMVVEPAVTATITTLVAFSVVQLS